MSGGVVPVALTLEARLSAATTGEAASAAAAALAASPLGAVARWAVPARARYRKVAGGLPPELAESSVESAGMELADGSLGSVYHPYGEEGWAFTLDALVPPGEADALSRVARAAADACRALLASGVATRVSVAWRGSGALCLPDVPVAAMRTQVVSATEEEVAAGYERPEAFWKSGWHAEKVGGTTLLSRALEARDSTELLERVQGQQWALARAAKPGLVKYGAPRVESAEDAVFRTGGAVLDMVGYDAAAEEVELSCAAKAGKHVPGWQVYEVLAFLQAGKLDDGRPVRSVRVVFLHPEAAQAEKRPLLDVGARVLAYDDMGMLVEIKD